MLRAQEQQTPLTGWDDRQFNYNSQEGVDKIFLDGAHP